MKEMEKFIVKVYPETGLNIWYNEQETEVCSASLVNSRFDDPKQAFAYTKENQSEFQKYVVTKDQSGITWTLNGKIHRVDGPAIKYYNGTEFWYQDGELHRVGGPALTLVVCKKQLWYQKGLLHREDGPAIIEETKDGLVESWYRYGTKVSPPTSDNNPVLKKLLKNA